MRRAVVRIACTIAALTVFFPTGAVAADGDPVGRLDSVSIRLSPAPSLVHSSWVITGWAADPDTGACTLPTTNPGCIRVHLYLDGRFVQDLGTGGRRPDVGLAYPWAGDNSGWLGQINLTDAAPHTVCAYAINKGAGANNTTLGCAPIPQGGRSAGDPKGHLDEAVASPGLVRLRGWAYDPEGYDNDHDQFFPPTLRVYNSQRRMEHVEQLERLDVQRAVPGAPSHSGFNFTMPVAPGRQTVCIYAGNQGATGVNNTTIGCATLNVPGVQPRQPGDPQGRLDAKVSVGQNLYDARGWAFDPDSPDPIGIRIRGIHQGFDFTILDERDGRADHYRPDVDPKFTGEPRETGFSIRNQVTDYVCAWALGVGPGNPERFIGCVN